MSKKLREQGTIADIPLRSTTKLYYVRMQGGQPGDEGWITVDEAKRMNSADRRSFGTPQSRYFQDQQSAQAFMQSARGMGPDMGVPGGEPGAPTAPPDMPPGLAAGVGPQETPADEMAPEGDMGAGDELGLGGDEELPPEEGAPEDDLGLGDEAPGEDIMGDEAGDLGDEEGVDEFGDLDLDAAPEEDELELVVPRRVRLVPAKESQEYWNKIRLLEDEKTEDPGWDFEKLAELAEERDLKPLEIDKLKEVYEENPETFEDGMKIEEEHSSCPVCQRIIASHHIQEFEYYYDELKKMEKKLAGGEDEPEETVEAQGDKEYHQLVARFNRTHERLMDIQDEESPGAKREQGQLEAELKKLKARMKSFETSKSEGQTFEDIVSEKCGRPGMKAKKAAGKSYSKTKEPEKFWGTAQKIQKAISKESQETEATPGEGPGLSVHDIERFNQQSAAARAPMAPRVPAMSLRELAEWVNNDEGLYNWWRQSRMGLRQFVQQNREEITQAVQAALGKPGDRPDLGVHGSRGWSESQESTEEGIVEALLSGDCSTEQAIESLLELAQGQPTRGWFAGMQQPAQATQVPQTAQQPAGAMNKAFAQKQQTDPRYPIQRKAVGKPGVWNGQNVVVTEVYAYADGRQTALINVGGKSQEVPVQEVQLR